MEVLLPSFKKLWNDWQLQALVLVSLLLQVILILLGNRRKYSNKTWIKIIVWPAYLLADLIATTALGVLTNRFVYHSGPLDAQLELTAFWAPFLLLHLGGPDTITAYSVEDNELWSRHLLQLAGQTGFAFYILSAGWTGSRVSFLTIPIMVAGLIKYGERTWVLWSASYEHRSQASTSPSYEQRSQASTSPSYEHRSQASTSRAPHLNILPSISDVQDNSNISDDELLQVSYRMLGLVKRLFVGVPISATQTPILANHQEETSNPLEKISPKDAFKVIEMQLGFMYDLLYTKAPVSYTPCGIVLRLTSFLLTSIVLVLFSLAPHNVRKYSKVDLCITFSLLVAAIVLELYAALAFLFSDRTLVWMRKHNFPSISRYITSLPIHRNHRWSNYMGQFDLLSYFFNEKPMGFRGILELLKINEKLEKQRYAGYRQVPEGLKEWLVMRSNKFWDMLKQQTYANLGFRSVRGVVSLTYLLPYAKEGVHLFSCFVEFHQTIIIWHIATELWYHLDHDFFTQKETRQSETAVLNRKMSKHISRYMMYLVAISPETLPSSGGIGQINFNRTCDEGRKEIALFDKDGIQREGKHKIEIEASKWLYEQHKDSSTSEDQIGKQLRGSLLPLGCVLAQKLIESVGREPEEEVSMRDRPEAERMESKWEVIASCWFEFLYHAGRQSSGNQHAQQLRKGGEFLTHIWLLYEEFHAPRYNVNRRGGQK